MGNLAEERKEQEHVRLSRHRRRVRSTLIRNIALTVLCVAIGICAAMQYRTILAKGETAQSDVDRINSLLTTINSLNAELNTLTQERDTLQEQINRIEQSSQDDLLRALENELDELRTFAGLTRVRGRGIRVTVNIAENTNINVLQRQLLLLVNEIRASGAQAISINGQRILPMTEIRVVSQYISVNGEQLSAPYEIDAIGDATKLYSGLTMSGKGIVYTINREVAGADCSLPTVLENVVIERASEEQIKTDYLQTME